MTEERHTAPQQSIDVPTHLRGLLPYFISGIATDVLVLLSYVDDPRVHRISLWDAVADVTGGDLLAPIGFAMLGLVAFMQARRLGRSHLFGLLIAMTLFVSLAYDSGGGDPLVQVQSRWFVVQAVSTAWSMFTGCLVPVVVLMFSAQRLVDAHNAADRLARHRRTTLTIAKIMLLTAVCSILCAIGSLVTRPTAIAAATESFQVFRYWDWPRTRQHFIGPMVLCVGYAGISLWTMWSMNGGGWRRVLGTLLAIVLVGALSFVAIVLSTGWPLMKLPNDFRITRYVREMIVGQSTALWLSLPVSGSIFVGSLHVAGFRLSSRESRETT